MFMITFLQGKLIESLPTQVVVDVNGVGYRVQIPFSTYYALPAEGGSVSLQIHTSVQEWRDKVFVHKHVVMRGDELLCEGSETRVFCVRVPGEPDRIKAIPVPEDIKAMCR